LAVLLLLLPRKADEEVSEASVAAESTSEVVEVCNPMKLSTEEAKDGVEMI
jgi:hypothetical protein